MYLLIPGRHHLLTSFQFEYLSGLASRATAERIDVFGRRLRIDGPIEGLVFAVTSANHAGTKRNPIPFHLRAMTIHEFSRKLDCATYVFGISDDGDNEAPFADFETRADLAAHLESLSTLSLFHRFARDFRRSEGEPIEFEAVDRVGVTCIRLKYRDACEFLLTKDYTDNWRSEMHETFCYWSSRDWEAALVDAGFRIHPASNAYQNPWIAKKHRWEGKAVLLRSLDAPDERLSPPTNMLLIGEKI